MAWNVISLSDMCSKIFAGGDVPKGSLSKYKTEEYNVPIFANGEKNKGLYGYTNIEKVTKPSITVSARGTIGYSEIRHEPFFPIVRLIVLTPDLEVVDLEFLKYIVLSMDFINSGSSIPQLTVPMIKDYKSGLPLIPEQKRIVAILDQAFADIDKARANAEQNLKNSRELFESYLQQVFSQRGEKWNNDRLDYLLLDKPRNGWSPPAKNHSDIGVPVLTLSSVTGFEFKKHKIKYTSAPTKLDAHYWVNNGDLLITRSNTPELVGHVAISSKIEVPTIYPDLIMKLKLDPKKVVTKFIYYQLRSDRLRRIITNSAQGANPTMKKINQGIVQGLPITYPSIKKQETIVKTLDSIYEASLILEKNYRVKLENLNELKKSILQKAFSGRLTDHIVKVH